MVGLCQAWHDITALDNTHGRTMLGVTCYHHLWTAYTIKRRWAWHDITAFGQHTRSNDVGCDMPSPPLDNTLGKTTSGVACHHHRWASPPLESIHGRQRRAWHDITAFGQHTQMATSCVAFHHCPWTAHTVGRCQTWHDITAFGEHTRLNDIRRGIPSSPMGSKHGQTTLGVA